MTADALLNVVHEDPLFVVVDKPSGMLSVPGRGPEKQDCVTARVKMMYPDVIQQPAVHRLDMDTSGLIVVALEAASHRNLSRQFEERKTHKRYIALLDGELDADSGTIELPFRLDVENRPLQIYDEVHGKVGISHWEKLSIENGFTRVAFTPITGRTHQLRVHAAHERGLGTPIVGDPFYGRGNHGGPLRLHACDLSFFHPETQQRMNFHSPPRF